MTLKVDGLPRRFRQTLFFAAHASPLLHALERMGQPVERAVYVGDSPHDLLAGRRAGVVTAAAAWGPFDHDTLRAEAPDLWLDAPTQLLRLLEV